MFIPDIPVIHRPHARFRVCRDSAIGANVLLSQGRPFRKRKRRSPRWPRGTRRKSSDGSRKKRGPGQPEGRSARRRRKPKPNPLSFEGPAEPEAPGRRNRERTSKKLRFLEVRQGTRIRSRKAEKEGTRQGTEAGREAGRGTRRNRNRTRKGPAKEPEGPTGAARPRPEPPWERRSRLNGQDQRT
jgi:hypothetical protein